MAFVDSLRTDPNERKREQDRYRASVMARDMQIHVRYWCERCKSSHKAEGYLMERMADDCAVNNIQAVAEVYLPPKTGPVICNPPRMILEEYRRFPRRSALNGQALCHAEYKMCALTEKEAVQYAAQLLRNLLAEDGFTGIKVQVCSLQDVYDEVREVGFFNTDIYFDRKKTSNIVGYTIKFHVEW